MDLLRRIALGLFAVGMFGLVLNYGYFIKHLEFLFAVDENRLEVSLEPTAPIKAEPNLLKIDSLNINAPIIFTEKQTETAYQEALQNGVVHFPGTAKIGQLGNAYIFGHSSDYPWSKGKYKTIFALLTKIKIGDSIVATDEAGHEFTYYVTSTKIVTPTDLSVLDQFQNKRKLLTLQTSYPIGTALKRFVVLAELKD